MATRQKTTIEQIKDPLENTAPVIFTDPDDELTDEDAIGSVLAELGGTSDAKVNVYEIGNGKSQVFVASYTPSNFSLEQLQADYGGGMYSIQVRSEGRIKTRRVVTIKEPRNIQQNHAQPVVDNTAVINAVNQSMQQLGTMFTDALTKLVPQTPQKTFMEQLQEFAALQATLGGGKNNVDSGNSLELFLKGIEFAKQNGPGGEKSMAELLVDGVKELAPVLATMAASKPAPIMLQPAAQRPVTSPVVSANNEQAPSNVEVLQPEQQAESEVNAMSMMENFYLRELVRHAMADHDTETYANMALDTLGDEKCLEYVNHPDYFKLLCEKVPEAAPYEDWFNRLKNDVIMLTAPENDVISSETSSTSGGNAVSN